MGFYSFSFADEVSGKWDKKGFSLFKWDQKTVENVESHLIYNQSLYYSALQNESSDTWIQGRDRAQDAKLLAKKMFRLISRKAKEQSREFFASFRKKDATTNKTSEESPSELKFSVQPRAFDGEVKFALKWKNYYMNSFLDIAGQYEVYLGNYNADLGITSTINFKSKKDEFFMDFRKDLLSNTYANFTVGQLQNNEKQSAFDMRLTLHYAAAF
jgi:hypothetical protein